MVTCEIPGVLTGALKTLSAPITRVRTIDAAPIVCGPAVTLIRVGPRGASVSRSLSSVT